MPCIPSVSSTGLSSTHYARRGAMACAHSTSSVVSPTQPVEAGWRIPSGARISSCGIGQAEGAVERMQIGANSRRTEGDDDGDGAALPGNAAAQQRIDTVGCAHLVPAPGRGRWMRCRHSASVGARSACSSPALRSVTRGTATAPATRSVNATRLSFIHCPIVAALSIPSVSYPYVAHAPLAIAPSV